MLIVDDHDLGPDLHDKKQILAGIAARNLLTTDGESDGHHHDYCGCTEKTRLGL